MATTLAIEKKIANFQDFPEHLGLSWAGEDDFSDWQDLAIAPSAHPIVFLDHLQQRYHCCCDSGIVKHHR